VLLKDILNVVVLNEALVIGERIGILRQTVGVSREAREMSFGKVRRWIGESIVGGESDLIYVPNVF